jgi:hypothetical protein
MERRRGRAGVAGVGVGVVSPGCRGRRAGVQVRCRRASVLPPLAGMSFFSCARADGFSPSLQGARRPPLARKRDCGVDLSFLLKLLVCPVRLRPSPGASPPDQDRWQVARQDRCPHGSRSAHCQLTPADCQTHGRDRLRSFAPRARCLLATKRFVFPAASLATSFGFVYSCLCLSPLSQVSNGPLLASGGSQARRCIVARRPRPRAA